MGCGRGGAGQADQVVSRGREGERPAHPFETAQAGARLPGDGLDPGERLLDPLARALVLGIARMARRPAVDRSGGRWCSARCAA